ncbi:MAG TPA: hypothetical protein VGN69_00735, partial [Solirubrobacteraceae bacterium]|nr:hypothetical protein [Solirubrobacteraceae bacterium]
MAAKDKAAKRAAKAQNAARAARSNPYIKTLIDDDDVRNNIRSAYQSARSAYGRMNNGKAPGKALLEDKKLQKQLRQAAQSLSDAGTSLRDAPKKRRRRGGLGKVLFVGLVGAGLALALNEGLRSKVLDALFGSEEEFDY